MNDITIMLLIVEEAKEIILYFSQGTVKYCEFRCRLT